jgi:putative peptidoglycan binding protein
MTVVKQLVENLIYPLAMGVGVALCLWILLGPLRIDRLGAAGQGSILATPDVPPASDKPPADVSQQDIPATPDRPLATGDPPADVSEQRTAAPTDLSLVPSDQPARPFGRIITAIEDLPFGAGDSGPLVTQLQGALIKNGYSVGLAGADGTLNDDTLASLGAFQDNAALPVQPSCDQQCWTALGLSRPQ